MMNDKDRTDLTTPPADYAAGLGLKRIVEEIDGAMKHGTWRDEHGMRLKDTPEWVAFYNSLAARPASPDTPALDAADARAVGVRELVWVELEQDRGDGTTDLTGDHEAETVVGTYQTELGFGSDSYYWSVARDGEEIGHSFEDLAYAKAAAQADYEARILSALHPASPLGAVAMREKAAQTANYWRGDLDDERDIIDVIRAIPLAASPAELLAAAAAELLNSMESPAVYSDIVDKWRAANIACQTAANPWAGFRDALRALAPFARKGE